MTGHNVYRGKEEEQSRIKAHRREAKHTFQKIPRAALREKNISNACLGLGGKTKDTPLIRTQKGADDKKG